MKKLDAIKPSYTDNEQALSVIDLLQSKKSVFLTGKAGTGKSYLVNQIRTTLKNKSLMFGPTGISAINIKGQTLHNFFGLSSRPYLPEDKAIRKLKGDKIKLLKASKLLIIDEISMVRADVLNAVNMVLQKTLNNFRPFGGKQVLVVGDLYQLPPVVTDKEREIIDDYYHSEFFFDAPALENSFFNVVQLSKVYRQSDPNFIRILDTIRERPLTQEQLDWLNNRVIKKPNPKSITLASTNYTATEINSQNLAKLRTKRHVFDAKVTGVFLESKTLPGELEFEVKKDAQIMMTNNQKDDEGTVLWSNGSLGKVVDILDDEIIIQLEDGKKHTVSPHTWKSYEYILDEVTQEIEQEETGSFIQFPMKLAWAITIHKSQGLTFNSVNIDLGRGAFSAGQTYVAMSRCKTLEGISLKAPLRHTDIIINDKVKSFLGEN